MTLAQNGTPYGPANVSTPWVYGLKFDGVNDWIDLAQDVVQNGTFSDPGAEWTCGADWTISAGSAHHASGAASKIEQTITTILPGGYYRVTYAVYDYAGSGEFGVSIGGNTAGNHSVDGTYVDYVFCSAAIDSIAIHADALAVFSVYYIKVELVDRIFSNRRLTIAAWVKPTDLSVGRKQGLVTNGQGDWTNLLVDGDMEAAGVGDWTAEGDGVLAKTTADAPHGGARSMIISHAVAAGLHWPGMNQHVVTIGKRYLVSGWGQGDGTHIPMSVFSASPWTGDATEAWQYFSKDDIADRDHVAFYTSMTDPDSVGHVMFDDLSLVDLTTVENGKQGLILDSGQTRFEAVIGGVPRAILGGTLIEDRWTFVVATRDYDGTNTTLSLYEDGVLVMSEFFAGAPDVSGHQTPMIGARGAGEFFEGELADNVTLRYGAASAAWVADEYARGIAVLYAGPYVEQTLAAPSTPATTITVHSWSDPSFTSDTFALLMVRDALGVWHPIGQAGQIWDADVVLSEVAAGGVLAVRFYCKGQTGFCCFDDVRFDNIVVTRAQVPARLRDKFERLILAGKPLHSWAGMLVDYV